MSRIALDLESAMAPLADPEWRAGLAALSDSMRLQAVLLVEDSQVIVALAERVARSPGDERGGSPWTSFVREVAVARRISDRAASNEIALARALVGQHPQTVSELLAGSAPAHRARVLVQECLGHDAAVAAAADEALAGRLAVLAPWRIRQEVDRLALQVDAEAAARRESAATAARTARLLALPDAQAEVAFTGPAVVVQRWWDALTDRARALRAAGDPRGLGALRFDLAMTTDPWAATGSDEVLAALGAPATSRPASDARRSRPVQAKISVPAATSLGLADEPGWLDGHGWISAPLSRQLLTVAELRKACVAPHSGELLDLGGRILRPVQTPHALREAIRALVRSPHQLRDVVVLRQPRHDPSPALDAFVRARDRYCDGPTGTAVPARRTEADHCRAWPQGPTSAANLACRSTRTHQLKHFGWAAVRNAAGTRWTSPAGQVVDVPAQHHPPTPPRLAVAPDPSDLAAADAALGQVHRGEEIDELEPAPQPPDPPPAPEPPRVPEVPPF